MNIGPWRLRNYTTWNRDSEGNDRWDTIYTYLQRNIIPLKAQVVLGDSASPADVFDSIPFRGGKLASDDDMLPDSLKGYAPVVRGSPVRMRKLLSGKTAIRFIKVTSRPARLRSAICTRLAGPAILR